MQASCFDNFTQLEILYLSFDGNLSNGAKLNRQKYLMVMLENVIFSTTKFVENM